MILDWLYLVLPPILEILDNLEMLDNLSEGVTTMDRKAMMIMSGYKLEEPQQLQFMRQCLYQHVPVTNS